MGQHCKPVVVVGNLDELNSEHDGSTVLVRAEVDVVRTTYLMVKDTTPLDRLVLVVKAKIGTGHGFPSGISKSVVDSALRYLDGLDESDPQKIDVFASERELVAAV